MERTGWWFNIKRKMFLNLNHHPVCAASDASHFLLDGATTPPGQGNNILDGPNEKRLLKSDESNGQPDSRTVGEWVIYT